MAQNGELSVWFPQHVINVLFRLNNGCAWSAFVARPLTSLRAGNVCLAFMVMAGTRRWKESELRKLVNNSSEFALSANYAFVGLCIKNQLNRHCLKIKKAQLSLGWGRPYWPWRSSKVDNLQVIWKPVCDFLLVINSNLGFILHRLATVHPWQTDGQTDGRQPRQKVDLKLTA